MTAAADISTFERAQADEEEIEIIDEQEFYKMFGRKFDPEEFKFNDRGDMDEFDIEFPDHFDDEGNDGDEEKGPY